MNSASEEASARVIQVAEPTSSTLLPHDAPHILLAVDQLLATLGGGERALWRLAAQLPRYGFRVSILTLAADPQSPILLDPPCPIYVLSLRRTWDFRAFRAALALRRFLRQQNVRLVQTFFESSDLWVGAVTKTVSGLRLIWSRRDMGILRGRKHRAAYRLLAGMPDFVFAVSDEVRRHCIDVDGIRPERVKTIYNGVTIDPAAPMHRSEQQVPRILAVGNIRHVKGHDVLVEAAAIVRRSFPEAKFAIAGERSEADYFVSLQRRAAELGLSDHFYLLGGVTNLEEEWGRATIFAMPSRSEGFSNAIVEAMAASLPVVATAVGGNPEAVVDGVTGILVPPGDPEVLAKALSRLLGNQRNAQEMGLAGRERALRFFTLEAMMSTTVDVYEKTLNS